MSKCIKFARPHYYRTLKFMRTLKANAIIHIFALTHIMTTLVCRLSSIDDSLLLTLLTMAMTIIVCFKRGINVEVTAASVVVVNIAGYLIGIGGASLIGLISKSDLLIHALSTFLTTEILGWSIIFFSKLFHIGDKRIRPDWTPRVKWLLLATAVIFLLRLGYTEIFNSRYFSAESTYRIIRMLINNSVALLLMLCCDIIYIRYMRRRHQKDNIISKTAVFLMFIISVTSFVTLIAGYNLPFKLNPTFTSNEFILLFTVSLLAETGIFSIIYMLDYATTTRKSMFREQEKARLAEFQYLKLKQQVNPHFLFNTLNILDCLVCENKTKEASTYIHKLAGIYRYMLQNEGNRVVRLSEEMKFVTMYADLLKVRFQEGFEINTDIKSDDLNRNVVPCSVQMLVENAIKHNIVSSSEILTIEIVSDGENVSVTNTVNLKNSAEPSTKVGLKYIRQQYKDLSGKQTSIIETGGKYTVTLPLI